MIDCFITFNMKFSVLEIKKKMFKLDCITAGLYEVKLCNNSCILCKLFFFILLTST